MGYSIQFQKLWRFEKRKWLLVVLLVAFTHLFCQLFVLPYGNALRSLFPGDELQMHDKGIFLSRFSSVKSVMLSNSIPVNASDSVDAKLLVSVVKNADKYVLGGNIGHGDVEMEEKMNSENDLTLGKKDLENSFDDVEKRKEGDDFPSENVVNLGESSVVANNQDYKHFLVKVNGSRHSLSVDQIVEPSNGSSMNNVPGGDASVTQVTVGTVGTAIVSPSVVLPQEESNHSQSANTSADDHFSSKGSANLNESSASQKYRDINDVSDKLIETEHSIAPEQIVEPISDGVSAETTVEEDTSDFDDITSSVDLVSNSSIGIDSAVVNRSSTGAEIILLPNNQSWLQFQSDISPPKNNSMTKKMRCEMPPKSVMSINMMNELLVRHRRSSRAMRPRWSSGHDQEILAAKMQIDNAPPAKNEIELYAPLFRNVSRFKRSYDLMERTLKVYIYKEGEKPIFHRPILKGLYASEGWFMKLMEGNRQFAVKDPRKAHLFYMPFSSRMLEYSLYVRNSHNRTNLRQYLKQYTETIAAKYRFWNRTGGADHFLVACHDWAPYETRHHMEHCIKALCNADVTTGFKIGRDISLPETYVRSARNPLRDLGGKPPSKRHILAFYAGNMHGYLRPILLKHWKDTDPDMKILGPMPPGVASKMNYIQHMRSSKYCICPKGYEVNSPRVVEAIFYECVPVIISDNFVPPFFEVLDWGAFSVILAEKDIPNLKDVLLSIPKERYLAMQLAVRMAQRHFLWHAKPLKYDLFHMTLHSIWYNRVYQIKVR